MKRKRSAGWTSLSVLVIAVVALTAVASAQWKEKVLYSFQGIPDGDQPVGAVVFDAAGNLYGATTLGGADTCPGIAQCGIVYKLQPPAKKGGPWSETELYIFKGQKFNDGETPVGGVIFDTAGNLYGTTAYGGSGGCILLGGVVGCGTVYKMTPPKTKGGRWTESVVYSFQGGTDGDFPSGDLTFDSAGNLYGATQYGGGFGSCNAPFFQFCGTIFRLSPPKTKGGKWTEKVLYSFKSGTDGANPNGGLLFDSKGAIYGTAYSGGGTSNCYADGVVGCGTVFQLTPPSKRGGVWDEVTIHRFRGGSEDTNTPMAGLIWDKNGHLYGTTAGGQNSGGDDGAIYRLAPPSKGRSQWVETLLHRLGGAEGVSPMAGLIFDEVGQLFGTASVGGTHGGGTVFRLNPNRPGAWTLSVLHAFSGTPDGSYPTARITFDKSGNIYSTTQQSGRTGGGCGNQGCGTVFMAAP